MGADDRVTMKNVFNGKHFVNEVAPVDNATFVNCSFEGCTLRYCGGPWTIRDCSFSSDTKLSFGGQAYLTMMLLKELDMIVPGRFADPSQMLPKRVN